MSLSSFVESLSSWRRLAIGFAILWGALVIITGGPSALMKRREAYPVKNLVVAICGGTINL